MSAETIILLVFLIGASIGYCIGLADSRWRRAHRHRGHASTAPPAKLMERVRHRMQAH